MPLTDLTQMDLPGETITLPIGGKQVVFRAPSAWFYRAMSMARTTGKLDAEVLPDDRDADEYRHLLGEHYDEMSRLSGPQWSHLVLTLTAWVIYGEKAAEWVWENRAPGRAAPAGTGGSSAGAPARTASTSGTSTTTAPRSRKKRRRRA